MSLMRHLASYMYEARNAINVFKNWGWVGGGGGGIEMFDEVFKRMFIEEEKKS